MQLITLASAAALAATVAANDVSIQSFNLNSTCDTSKPTVRVHNRCNYEVYLWSVLKGLGCPEDGGATLAPGDFYQENFRPAYDGVGTSIKLSKSNKCKDDNVQLEYYLETANAQYASNYLDVSYVDCLGGDCPTKQEGFYLKSGNQDGKFLKNAVNEICPILSCGSADECAKMAYILPDDRQTKSCDLKANLDFYMCGGEAPGEETYEPPASEEPASSEKPAETPKETPQPSASEPAYTPEVPEVPAYTEAEVAAAAAVTSAPAGTPHIKTEVVYVTEYVHAKRHVHGHRHQQFRA